MFVNCLVVSNLTTYTTGYSMPLLNSILLKYYGLSSLKSELKSKKPIGVTNEQIDLLFNKFEEVMK